MEKRGTWHLHCVACGSLRDVSFMSNHRVGTIDVYVSHFDLRTIIKAVLTFIVNHILLLTQLTQMIHCVAKHKT